MKAFVLPVIKFLLNTHLLLCFLYAGNFLMNLRTSKKEEFIR